MLELIFWVITLGVFLFLFYQTDFIAEYFQLLSGFCPKIIRGYWQKRQDCPGLIKNWPYSNFIGFLSYYKHEFFIVRLIECPYCLGFWISVIISTIWGAKYFGLIFIILLLIYLVLVRIKSYLSIL